MPIRVKKLFFAYLEQVSSLRSLAVELQTNQKCQALDLNYTPFSTLKDGFCRFSSEACRSLFETVLSELKLKRIKVSDEIGLFRVIDGSLFPLLDSDELERVSKEEKRLSVCI